MTATRTWSKGPASVTGCPVTIYRVYGRDLYIRPFRCSEPLATDGRLCLHHEREKKRVTLALARLNERYAR